MEVCHCYLFGVCYCNLNLSMPLMSFEWMFLVWASLWSSFLEYVIAIIHLVLY